eukprot:2920235-Rhodomonas_salina.1
MCKDATLDDDTHLVAASALPPSITPGVDAVVPSKPPCTVTLEEPVAARFAACIPLIPSESKENARESVPT